MSAEHTYEIIDAGYALRRSDGQRFRVMELLDAPLSHALSAIEVVEHQPGGRLALRLVGGERRLVTPGAPPAPLLLRGIRRLLTMAEGLGEGPLGALSDAAVLLSGGEISWVGL